jgi:16S rRNA (cytosine1402-N4)-methyltransferase
MTNDFHQPVMVDEVIEYLVTDTDGTYVDATAGGGSHTRAILERLSASGRVLAIDRDDEAITRTRRRISKYSSQVRILRGPFSSLRELTFDAGIASVSGTVFDLGISGRHLDHAQRGFSYRLPGPLDCRMDRRHPTTAADIVNTASLAELANILFEYGGEKNARRIAEVIDEARRKKKLTTTNELVSIIESITNPRYLNKTLSRCFQGIRIAVNDELNELRIGLEAAFDLLDARGHLVVISYHSLEDRIVKRFIRDRIRRASDESSRPGLRPLTKRPVTPRPEEIESNPRARSAKLRAAEKV